MRNKERHFRKIEVEQEVREVFYDKPFHIKTISILKKRKMGTFKVQSITQKIKFQIGYREVPIFGTEEHWLKPIYQTKVINHLPVVVQ